MRGKLFEPPHLAYHYRITPADAGKTDRVGACRENDWDHPRGCGENAFMAVCFGFVLGSPPRMRGKRKSLFANSHGSRITPADAGKTHRCGSAHRGDQDHPRGCGENRRALRLVFGRQGSPPRMREKQSHGQERFARVRITPADAGKTKATLNERFVNQDHPRGCGENA